MPKKRSGTSAFYGGFYDDGNNLSENVGKLESSRLAQDDAANKNQLIEDSTHANIGGADYGLQFSTLKGGMRAGCNTCKNMKQGGGCLTCPKGQGKIIAIVRTFSIVIPKYFKQYKAISKEDKPESDTNTIKYTTRPAKKPAKKPVKKPAKKPMTRKPKQGGGIVSSSLWGDELKYSNDLRDLSGLKLDSQKTAGVYNIDNTLSAYTSVIV
jgi:hypothetical protein